MTPNVPQAGTQSLEERVQAEREKGNVVFQALPGQFLTVPVEKFVQQPVEGILYDLNRLEEVVLTFIDNPKWVNDYAVAQVIRELVRQRDAALSADSRQIREDARRPNPIPLLKRMKEQRDQLAEVLRWMDAKGGLGLDVHQRITEALKDVPSPVQQLRNIAKGLDMEYDELIAAIAAQGEKG